MATTSKAVDDTDVQGARRQRKPRGKPKRAANGMGCVGYRESRRGAKKWYVWVPARKRDGSWGRKYEYHLSREEAEAARVRLLSEKREGRLILGKDQKLADYINQWLDSVIKQSRSANTYRNYRAVADRYIIPYLGRIRLTDLTAQHLEQWLIDLCAYRNRKTRKGLSAGSVHGAWRVLRSAMNRAKRLRLVVEHPCNNVDAPSYRRPKVKPLHPDQAHSLLEVVRGDRLQALWTVGLALGLRPGEILGLRWDDVDWSRGRHGTIEVRVQMQRDLDNQLAFAELKTSTATRILLMPEVCAVALHAHLDRQKFERERAERDGAWEDHNLIFCTEGRRRGTVGGRPLDRHNVSRIFQRACKKAGIDHASLYQLRHTCASLLLAMGANLHEIKEVLGHNTIVVTSDTYAHMYAEGMQVNADRMDRALG